MSFMQGQCNNRTHQQAKNSSTFQLDPTLKFQVIFYENLLQTKLNITEKRTSVHKSHMRALEEMKNNNCYTFLCYSLFT